MFDDGEVCGNCKYHGKEGDVWVCTNPDSEHYSDWTEYDHDCDEWEGR